MAKSKSRTKKSRKNKRLKREKDGTGCQTQEILYRRMTPLEMFPVVSVLKDNLDWKDLKNGRLMNRTWDVAIKSKFFKNSHFVLDTPCFVEIEEEQDNEGIGRINWDRWEDEQELNEEMDKLEKVFPLFEVNNAWVSLRSLKLDISCLESNSVGFQRLLTWLNIYGRRITHLNMEIFEEFENFQSFGNVDISNVFTSLIKSLPCLESIILPALWPNASYILPQNERLAKTTSISIKEGETSLRTVNLLQEMISLRKLKLKFWGYEINHSLTVYQERNILNNIEILNLETKTGVSFISEDIRILSLIEFHRLKFLSMDEINFSEDLQFEGVTHLVTLLNRVNKTLEHLSLDFSSVEGENCHVEQLLCSLPQLPVLTSFTLFAWEAFPKEALGILNRLPKLEELKLKLSERLVSKSLEYRQPRVFKPQLFPKEDFTNESLKSLDIYGDRLEVSISNLFKIGQSFPNIRQLFIPVLVNRKNKSLGFVFKTLEKFVKLEHLDLHCLGLKEQDLNTSLTQYNLKGVKSLGICNDVWGNNPNEVLLKLGNVKNMTEIKDLQLTFLRFYNFRVTKRFATEMGKLIKDRIPHCDLFLGDCLVENSIESIYL